jgi:hypothetical protein
MNFRQDHGRYATRARRRHDQLIHIHMGEVSNLIQVHHPVIIKKVSTILNWNTYYYYYYLAFILIALTHE